VIARYLSPDRGEGSLPLLSPFRERRGSCV
jgi:hypothetical protein